MSQYGPGWEQRLADMIADHRERVARRKATAEAFRTFRRYGIEKRHAIKLARAIVDKQRPSPAPITLGEIAAEYVARQAAAENERRQRS